MGSEYNNRPWYKKSHIWLLILLGIVILAGLGNADTSKTKSSTKPATIQASRTTTQQSKQQETAKATWNPAAINEQIQAGMTKTQAEQIIGKTSTDCSKTSIQGYGESESCFYRGGFGDKGTIYITYHDGVVETKSKSDF